MTFTRDASLAPTILHTAPRCRGGWRHARRHCRGRRTGSVYAMVLGVTMLITVIGVGALATARVSGRATSASVDWQEAGGLAFSAVEHAVAKINADGALAPGTWRSAYQNARTDFSAPMGRGTMSWALVDEGDGIIADDYADPIKVYGIGQVGKVRRVYSAQLTPAGAGLDVLRTAFHVDGEINPGGGAMIVVDGPASTNDKFNGSTYPKGNGGIEVAGPGGPTVAPRKPMPSPGVFDLYRAKWTVIDSATATDGEIAPSLLSADSNPYGTEQNPEGIYYLRLPDTISTLRVLASSRIKGTLVIEGAADHGGQELELVGPIAWEPHRADLPALITRGIKVVKLSGRIAPYQDPAGVVRQAAGGLFHLIGTTDVLPADGTYLKGCLVADGKLATGGTFAVTANPLLLTTPPLGYSRGDRVALVPGTWKWDKLPGN